MAREGRRAGRDASRWSAAWLAALLCTAAGAPAHADPPAAGASGVELVGRTPDEPSPERWSVVDEATGNVAAKVEGEWGVAAVPPGDYVLTVLPRGHYAVEVRWGAVKVEEGRVAKVELRSGVELSGRTEDDGPLEVWKVIDKASGTPVAVVSQRWGFTPLPPGSYEIRIQHVGHYAVEVAWEDVTVAEGQVAKVRVASGVEVVGRSPEDASLETWKVVPRGSEEPVAVAWQRWGFTPVRPGSYSIRVLPRGHSTVEIPWTEVEVSAGTPAAVKVASGIDLAENPERPTPPEWVVLGASGEPVARALERWGFTPLPPGTYDVKQVPVRWPRVRVGPDEVVSLREPDLASRFAR